MKARAVRIIKSRRFAACGLKETVRWTDKFILEVCYEIFQTEDCGSKQSKCDICGFMLGQSQIGKMQ